MLSLLMNRTADQLRFWGIATCFMALSGSIFAQEPAEAKAEPAAVVQALEDFGGVMIDEAVQPMLAMPMEDGEWQLTKIRSKVAVDNALVRRTCKLDAEQIKQIEALDAKWVKSKAAAKKKDGLAAGVLRVFAGGNVGMQPDNPAETASRVSTAHKSRLKEILNPEQLAEYEKHVQERDTFRNQANAECIVAMLEDRLSLNKTQRTELVKSLSEWPGIQKVQPTFYFQNQSFIPNLPASALKVLTDTQRKILDGMQKADFQIDMFNDGQEAVFITQ